MQPVIFVHTFRKGLLAKLGHDLRLSLTRFEITLESSKLQARFDAASLRVDGAMRDGTLDARALSASDRAEIERAITSEVLQSARYPTASFAADVSPQGPRGFALGGRLELRGRLELHGVTQPLSVIASVQGGALTAELTLEPSRFGIAPYRALGGALKLEDRVTVSVALPVSGLAGELSELSAARGLWTSGAAS